MIEKWYMLMQTTKYIESYETSIRSLLLSICENEEGMQNLFRMYRTGMIPKSTYTQDNDSIVSHTHRPPNRETI